MLPIFGLSNNRADVSIFQMKTQRLHKVSQQEMESIRYRSLLPNLHLSCCDKIIKPKSVVSVNAPSSGQSAQPPNPPWPGAPATTLVEVGQCLFMQLHGWGRGSTQHVLQGWQAGLALGGQLGLLLLEDGQREHITATHRGRGQDPQPRWEKWTQTTSSRAAQQSTGPTAGSASQASQHKCFLKEQTNLR